MDCTAGLLFSSGMSLTPPATPTINYLVVGGGGGGGTFTGGGGGAGGLLNSTSSVDGGIQYTVTVGSGGSVGVKIGRAHV